MKKSDFEAQRREHWRRAPSAGSITEFVRHDVAAAEAAGIAWEPEAPALPERLGLRGISVVAEDQHFGHPFVADARMNFGGNDFDGYGAAQAVLNEAVRRYNAWPALRAWANGSDGPLHAGGLDRFLAILDGPAQ